MHAGTILPVTGRMRSAGENLRLRVPTGGIPRKKPQFIVLNRRADERDLEDVFGYYGKLRRVDIKNGYAFVHFDDDRDAEDAIRGEDGKDFMGRSLIVEPSRGGRDGGGGGRFGGKRFKWRLKVKGLDSRTSWQDLKDFAREAGDVAFTDVTTERGKRIGIIEYTNEDDMVYAIKKLDDTKLDGAYVRLVEERDDSRSRSRSDSRDRSRSRSDSRNRDRKKKDRKENDRDDDREKDRDDDREKDRGDNREKDREKDRDDRDKGRGDDGKDKED